MSILLSACLVVALHDGDTLTVKCDGRVNPLVLRVAEVDAPELAAFTWKTQPGAYEARDAARELCLNKKAVVRLDDFDTRTRRWIARVECNGTDLSHFLVGAGLAWSFMPRPRSEIPALQLTAMVARLGVWDGAPIAPSLWRKGQTDPLACR